MGSYRKFAAHVRFWMKIARILKLALARLSPRECGLIARALKRIWGSGIQGRAASNLEIEVLEAAAYLFEPAFEFSFRCIVGVAPTLPIFAGRRDKAAREVVFACEYVAHLSKKGKRILTFLNSEDEEEQAAFLDLIEEAVRQIPSGCSKHPSVEGRLIQFDIRSVAIFQ